MTSFARRLYWSKPYKTHFTAKVKGISSDAVALDQTLFYPASGGQASDLGFLRLSGTKAHISVIAVEKDETGVIWHRMSKNDLTQFKIGVEIEGTIDWDRRYQLMRSHTSQHILSAAILQIAGIQTRQAIIETTGIKLVLEEAISDEDLVQALVLSNEIATSAHPIVSKILTSKDAKTQLETLRKQQIPPGEEIRIIEILGHDKMACGGTHVRETTEVGPMYLLERRPQVLTYVVGRQALEKAAQNNLSYLELGNRLNVTTSRIVETIQMRLDTLQLRQEQRNEAIKAFLSCKTAEKGVHIGEIVHQPLNLTFSDRKIALRELGKPHAGEVVSVLIEKGIFLIFSNSKYPAKDLMAEFCKRTGGKGGGSNSQAQCSVQITNPHQVLEEILREYESRA
ncbi:MAG: alanine--tRNA ligase-related protein [Candidatus Hodarchaeota archaeon]